MKNKTCQTCGKSTYKPRQRIYTKYCGLTCRNNDPNYWASISETKKKQVISEEQKKQISIGLKRYFKLNPIKKKILDSEYQRYYLDCQFKFNVYDYPSEFNLALLEEFGWYKAKNKGDNLHGISRDHMISIAEGYKLKIDSSIIAHPANCRLIKQIENSSKGKKSLISIEDRKSTRLNSSHSQQSRMPSSA